MYPDAPKRILKREVWIVLIVVVSIALSVSASLFSEGDPRLRFVSGTEYISGEYGQAIVRVADNNGNGIDGATCFITILYPDKTFFITDGEMRPSSEKGNYYREFITPNQTGIYEEIAECRGEKRRGEYTLTVSSSFHVSIALNFIMELSKAQEERYHDLVERINKNRDEILQIIDHTYNVEVKEFINQRQEEMLQQAREERGQEMMLLQQNISRRLDNVGQKFAILGDSMQVIFSEELVSEMGNTSAPEGGLS